MTLTNVRAMWRCGMAAILFSVLLVRPVAAAIHYRVSLANPSQHVFHVEMVVPNMKAGMHVAIPAWNALYQVRDFGSRVQNVQAQAVLPGGAPLPLHVQRVDKGTWQFVAPLGAELAPGAELHLQYAIYWDDPGPFNSQLNSRHAFVNFAEVLFYVPDRRNEESRVQWLDVPADWKMAVELPNGDAPMSMIAASYDALADAPAELGDFQEFLFEDAGVIYRVVVDGGPWNQDRLKDSLQRIVNYETGLMGGAPFHEYLFLFHFGPGSEVGGGGMEHANSTAIATGSGDYASPIASHEFFHLWNVKRIRPQSLEPVDYTREQYTRALWFAEGVTSTYGKYALLRSGLWTRQQFYSDLASQCLELDSRPASKWQSVEESSLNAWMEKYGFYNGEDFSISYYNKGQILGDLLDLSIRDATDGKTSLDDILRYLYQEYAEKNRFYDDSKGIRDAAGQVSGHNYDEFFRRFVAGTDAIDYNHYLSLAGLRLAAHSTSLADIGFATNAASEGRTQVSMVTEGSNAFAAGVRAGDFVLQINGSSPPRNLDAWARARSSGDSVKVMLQRGQKQWETTYTLGQRPEKAYSIEEIPQATERQKQIREGWLKGAAK
jgi:predicted metalloprotease with PDZ domain